MSLPGEVAFHFNATDKLAYACRLLRKAHGLGASLHVLAQAEMAARLDAALWTLSTSEFLPHCLDNASAHVVSRTPIIIGPAVMNLEVALNRATRETVLVNLSAALPSPASMGRYQRIIEVVSTTPDDRELARERWRWYRSAGLSPLRHDLSPSASRALA